MELDPPPAELQASGRRENSTILLELHRISDEIWKEGGGAAVVERRHHQYLEQNEAPDRVRQLQRKPGLASTRRRAPPPQNVARCLSDYCQRKDIRYTSIPAMQERSPSKRASSAFRRRSTPSMVTFLFFLFFCGPCVRGTVCSPRWCLESAHPAMACGCGRAYG